MAIPNQFPVTDFISKNTVFEFESTSPMANSATYQVSEFGEAKLGRYASGGQVLIQADGFPILSKGSIVQYTPLTVKTYPIILDDTMIYDVAYQLNGLEQATGLIGGERAMTGNPFRKNGQNTRRGNLAQDRYIGPAGVTFRAGIEKDIALEFSRSLNQTPRDTWAKAQQPLNSFSDVSEAAEMMSALSLPESRRWGCFDNNDFYRISDSLSNSYNSQINEAVLRNGVLSKSTLAEMRMFAGFASYRTPYIPPQIAGLQFGNGALAISSISADGSQITLSGALATTGLIIHEGDMFSIPTVKLINKPGQLEKPYNLVITANKDAYGNGTGLVTVIVSDPISAIGMHRNVTALPAVGDFVEMYGNHKKTYLYLPNALQAVTLSLPATHGATTTRYRASNMEIMSEIQGEAPKLINSYMMRLVFTSKVIPEYGVVLPSAI